jgi:hypothetical protein
MIVKDIMLYKALTSGGVVGLRMRVGAECDLHAVTSRPLPPAAARRRPRLAGQAATRTRGQREDLMSENRPYEHSSTSTGGSGDGDSAQTEHRDTARPTGDQPNESTPEERNERSNYGPRTQPATRIDPDPLFDDTES